MKENCHIKELDKLLMFTMNICLNNITYSN